MKIVLSDLAHTYAVADQSLPIPLGIGYVKAYAKQVHGEGIDITLFKHPELFIAHVLKHKPEIIGFANYGWNEKLNRAVGKYLKPFLPHTIFVAGGPNIDDDVESQSVFMREHSYLDYVIVDGGEEPFSELITWIDNGRHQDELPQNLFWRDDNGELRSQPLRKVAKKIENISSPYLSGSLDEFIERGMMPLFETNRGCPFLCTFCGWGMPSKNLVRSFEEDVVLEEFEYVGARSSSRNWIICDANFGMLKRDVDLAKKIRSVRDRYGAPNKCHIWLAKNTTDRNLEIAEILGDMVVPVMAVQSLDDTVLKHIKRGNIKIDTYIEYQKRFHAIGHRTYSDVIVPLPEETIDSHLSGLRQLFEFGVDIIQNHNCRLLPGASLNSPETRSEFGFMTAFRLIHGDAGRYKLPDGGEIRAFEYEESLRSTTTMSEEEMFFLRKLHFLVDFCWNLDTYKLLLKFGMEKGFNPLDILISLIDETPRTGNTKFSQGSNQLATFWRMFDNASRNEWFNSSSHIEEYFEDEENFTRLVEGEFEKLNTLYAVIALRDFKSEFDAAILGALQTASSVEPEICTEVLTITQAMMPGLEVQNQEVSIDVREFSGVAQSFLSGLFSYDKAISFLPHPERKKLIELIQDAECEGFTLSKVLNTQNFSLRSLCFTEHKSSQSAGVS